MNSVQVSAVVCPGCRHADSHFISKVFSSPVRILTDLVRCRSCRLLYINPRPSRESEKEFYEKEYFERADFKEWRENRLPFFSFAIKKLQERVRDRHILDIGCGGGFFLDMLRKDGWNVYGLELSRAAVQYAQEHLQLPVYQTEIQNAGLVEGQFGVVTLWNVLDQMWDPNAQIEEVCRILKPGGCLALRVTNGAFHVQLLSVFRFLKSLALLPRDLREPTVFHLTMFDAASIKQFLESRGFSDIEVLNSPLDSAPQVLINMLGVNGAHLLTRLCYALFRFFFGLTRKTFGPSLFIIAKRK